MTPAELAKYIDHTILAPEATQDDVKRLCAEANLLGVAAICVSPSMLPLTDIFLDPEIAVASVVGFPSGAHHIFVKAAEAQQAFEHGADEIDMVINLANVKASDWGSVRADVAAVRAVLPANLTLKVIIESAALTNDEIIRCCQIAVDAGAQFVKTSTGFHKSGGATPEAVALMRQTVGSEIGVKASGGIRTYADAVQMIDAGATRIGASASATIIAGASERG